MKTVLLLAGLLFAAPGHGQDYRDLPADLPCRYGVLGVRPTAIGPDSLIVDKVLLYSPAHRAGLQEGDRIIAIPPYRIRTAADLSRCVQSHAPGDTLSLVLRRGNRPLQLTCAVSDIKHLYYLMDEIATETPQISAHINKIEAPAAETIAGELIRQYDASTEFAALKNALAFDAGRYGDDTRLQSVDLALHNPLATGRIASALADKFTADTSPISHLQNAAKYLHIDLAAPIALQITKENSGPALILEELTSARQSLNRAFADLTQTEQNELIQAIPGLLERFGDTFLLDSGDSTETVGHIRTLRLAKKIDLEPLFASALHLARLADPDALKSIRKKMQKLDPALVDSLPSGVDGNFLFAAHTALGWVLVGDRGRNIYDTDAAAIIDLGGDDIYLRDEQTSPDISLIIDYEGNDRYIGGHIATGLGGLSLLIDRKGDDLYQGGALSIATAFCGVGLLLDQAGNDQYLSRQAGQGTAFFGAGLLIDRQGDDFYTADLFAQGFGGMRGFGLLHDLAGDDHYIVDGKVPSSYGTPDTYAGWGQGVGCGFRGYGSGGIGLLLDEDGHDYYQGGDFAQGVGYFFGLGVLGDLRGNDQYRGSRYAQGAAAHQAVGALLEGAGNDRYEAKIAASQGAGWDAAIGYLADLAGDDRYEALNLSQGAAAMNGLGFLFDGGGQDHYLTRTGQGQGSSTTYWGGRNALNLGLLIDLGGSEDAYSLRKNQADAHDGGIGLFSDR